MSDKTEGHPFLFFTMICFLAACLFCGIAYYYLKQQQVEGVIAAVRAEPAHGKQHLVMLTIGSNENVKEGTLFEIKRDDEYIATVKAQKIFPDMVACVIDQTTWNDNGLSINLGDSAISLLLQW